MAIGARAAGGRGQRPFPGGPLRLPAGSWPGTLRRTGQEALDDHLFQWAAALTFFTVLSLFPAMLALVALLGLIGTAALQPLIENVSALAPGTARDLTLDALEAIRRERGSAGPTFALGLAVALWSASGYVGAFIPAANVVWEVEEERPWYRKLVLRIALTVALLLMIAVAALGVVLTGPIAEEVGGVVGLGEDAVRVWSSARWPVLALAIMAVVGFLYWSAPNVDHPGWRWIVPGSVLAVVLWIGASLAFTAYVSNFGRLNATYGSIGGVLVFLIWLWIANSAILLGAQLTAELERTGALEANREGAAR